MNQPNYIKKLNGLVQSGGIPAESVGDVQVYHDGWCAHNTGGVCNCDPDIKYIGRTAPTAKTRFKSRDQKR